MRDRKRAENCLVCGCVQCGVGFSLSRALLTHGMFAHEGLKSKQHLRLTLRNSGSQQSTEVAKTHFLCRRNGHWVVFWQCGFLAFFFEKKKKCTWSSQWSPELPSEQGKGFQNMEFYVPVTRCGSFALQSIVLRFFGRGSADTSTTKFSNAHSNDTA